jgi:hypothetical protein
MFRFENKLPDRSRVAVSSLPVQPLPYLSQAVYPVVHLLKGPRLRIIPSMLLTRCGKAGLCSRHGLNQRRSVPHIVGQGTTSRCI